MIFFKGQEFIELKENFSFLNTIKLIKNSIPIKPRIMAKVEEDISIYLLNIPIVPKSTIELISIHFDFLFSFM